MTSVTATTAAISHSSSAWKTSEPPHMMQHISEESLWIPSSQEETVICAAKHKHQVTSAQTRQMSINGTFLSRTQTAKAARGVGCTLPWWQRIFRLYPEHLLTAATTLSHLDSTHQGTVTQGEHLIALLVLLLLLLWRKIDDGHSWSP